MPGRLMTYTPPCRAFHLRASRTPSKCARAWASTCSLIRVLLRMERPRKMAEMQRPMMRLAERAKRL
ncbi:MAG: hypothetical protein A2051_02495 [Desulfovibrionales bacterium GWA2_65_9]|nr:MAG: hypothetical protein A2051_02495 [Desulfovibrionales bacterium GWA2_65_9]